MERLRRLSSVAILIILLVGVVGLACSKQCPFCGAYQLQTDPNQSIAFTRDGTFYWVTLSARSSGHWYADGNRITVTAAWGTFRGTIEGDKFIDSQGSIWVKAVSYRPCIFDLFCYQ